MRKKFLLLTSLSLFLLSGCDFLDRIFGIKKDDSSQKDEQKDEEEKQTQTKVGEFYGGLVNEGEYVGYEFSKSETELSKPTTGVGEINIYAINDFHGAVLQNGNEAGIKTVGSFLKEKSKQENTLILDQGDTWQGSFESNYKYGAIVQDVFNYAGVSLRTVGNHDFDWGLNHLEETNNRQIGDDYIPCLAANVFDYKDGQNGSVQQSQYGKEYATFTLDNGVKVGVVGVIGESQITSICSQLVDTVCFTNHVRKIKEISDYLRTKKNCDIVIASAHESSGDLEVLGLTSVSPVSHKRYTDLILGGHSHSKQESTENGVKLVQWHSNGRSTGSISLKYNFETNSLVDNDTKVFTYYDGDMSDVCEKVDPTIEKMVDDYLEEIQPVADEVLSDKFSGYFDDESLAYLMSESIYYSVKSMGINVDFAVCNYARSSFEGTSFTYSDLYKCFPFDNQIILMDVSSSTSISSINRNESYREDISLVPTVGTTYKIAVIDYLAFHQNENRENNYFPDALNVSVLSDASGEPLIYRNILKDYLKNNPTKSFNASDYNTNNPHCF